MASTDQNSAHPNPEEELDRRTASSVHSYPTHGVASAEEQAKEDGNAKLISRRQLLWVPPVIAVISLAKNDKAFGASIILCW